MELQFNLCIAPMSQAYNSSTFNYLMNVARNQPGCNFTFYNLQKFVFQQNPSV